MGVHLTSRVIGGNVDLVLLNETSNLDIGGGLDELNTSQSALGDDTGTIAGLCAPGNGLRNKKGRRSEQNGDRTSGKKPTSPSMTPISELGVGGPQRQKSSIPLITAVWQREFGPSVYETDKGN